MRALARVSVASAAVGLLAVTGLNGVGRPSAHASGPRPSDPAVIAPALLGARTATPVAPVLHRPNVLMITTDDMSTLDLAYMPHVRHLLADHGTEFSDAIAPTPICVPARATLLTGQYAGNDGARTISGPHGGFGSFDDSRTLPVDLQRAGYDTLFTGKYLNGYDGVGQTYVPPGWTDWRATSNGTYNFMSQVLNVNHRLQRVHRYTTFTMRDQANQMLAAPQRRHRPWYLWVNYVAPHFGGPTVGRTPGTTVPAPQDRHRFSRLPLPKRPDMFEKDVTDKPRPSPARRLDASPGRMRVVNMRRVQALQAVDRAVASHIAVLRRTHQLRRTIVIFDSDNGYAVGEHRIEGKLWFYGEILRVPLLMRGPGIPKDRRTAMPISLADLEATILAATGARSERPLDGVDMLPWLDQPARRRIIPIAGWAPHDGSRRFYRGVTVGPWTYIRYLHGAEEAYDHRTDPYELRSLVHTHEEPVELAELRALARWYAGCAGSGCPKGFYAGSAPGPASSATQRNPRFDAVASGALDEPPATRYRWQ